MQQFLVLERYKHCTGVTSDITDMEGNIRNIFLQTICIWWCVFQMDASTGKILDFIGKV